MRKHMLPLLLMLVAGRLFSATVSGFVTREDSGGGACEVVYVCAVSQL